MITRALIVVVALLSPALTGSARAFVRGQSDAGIPLYWTTSCAVARIYLDGFTQMSADAVAAAIAAAAHAWSPDAVTCAGGDGGASSHPYFEIVPTFAPAGAVPKVAYDYTNAVIFRVNEPPSMGGGAADPDVLAVTSRWSGPAGRILDADIEIDAHDFMWGDVDPGAATHVDELYDLQDALTHEFGHFIGLDHTCFNADVDETRAVDDQGAPIPDCDAAPAAATAAVMYPFIDPGETSKRFLSDDDVRAVCAVYPAAQDPKMCTLDLPDDGCGCALAARTGGPIGSLALLALAAAIARARQSRTFTNRRARREPR